MSIDKNGYYISLNKKDYEALETQYTLYIYDYDTGAAFMGIVIADHNGYIDDVKKLSEMYQTLRKFECDFTEIYKHFVNLCNENNIYFEAA